MRYYRLITLRLCSLSLAMLASVGRIQAQSTDCRCDTGLTSQTALVLQGGGWLIDQDATVFATRAELPISRTGRWLLVPGLTYARGDFKSSPRSSLLIPEVRLDWQISQGRIRPFVGTGAGFSIGNLIDRQSSEMLTAVSGLRADLSPDWGARLEVEMRLAGGFVAGSAGWGLGIARRF
jgi:hypothetical protein